MELALVDGGLLLFLYRPGDLLQGNPEAPGERLRLSPATLRHEEAYGFRQVLQAQRHDDHERHQRDQEHDLPAETGYEQDGEASRQEATDVVAGHHGRVGDVAPAAWRVLQRQGRRHGYEAAQPDAGEEAEEAEQLRRGRYTASRREDREPGYADQERLAPPDYVRDGAGEQRADKHAYDRVTAYDPHPLGR